MILNFSKIEKFLFANWKLIFLVELFLVVAFLNNYFGGHWSPLTAGSVQEGESIKIAQTYFEKCSASSVVINFKETCYQKEFETLASQRGSKFSFEVLSSLQAIDPSSRQCHLISHGLGQGVYQNNARNWQEEIKTIDTSCNYGAIHGVIQAYIGTLPGAKLTQEIVPTLCGENPRGDCNHIVGHLILVETKSQINPALEMCSVFTDSEQLHYCYAGVFMEFQTVDNLIEHGYATQDWKDLPKRLPAIEKMCRSFSGEKEVACWESIAYSAFATWQDARKVFNYCDKAPVDEGAMLCKRYTLVLLAVNHSFDIASLKNVCQIPQSREDNFEGACYSNLASIALVTVPRQASSVVSFCNGLAEGFKENCYSTIGFVLNDRGVLNTSEIEEVCSASEQGYQEICLNTGNVGDVNSTPILETNYNSTR